MSARGISSGVSNVAIKPLTAKDAKDAKVSNSEWDRMFDDDHSCPKHAKKRKRANTY